MTQKLALGCAVFLSGCSPFVAELLGRPCDNGDCVSGYQCSPVTNRCVRGLEIGCEPGQLCPDNITEGTACEDNGSFIPCAGLGTDCSNGCRFCTDGTWSACDVSACNPSDTPTRSCYPHGTGLSDPSLANAPCAAGTQPCEDADQDGTADWGACVDAVTPVTEACGNGVDDDCDGSPDEGCECTNGNNRDCYTGALGTEDVGPCHSGTQACSNNAWGPCVGQVVPVAEVCNGADDDCNGAPDNGVVAPGTPPCPQQGVCVGAPVACTGAGGWVCQPVGFEASEITCDGKDNDCDGNPDDGLTPPPGLCDPDGVCGLGVPTCGGAGGWSCVVDEYEPVEISCDTKDNDCDGNVDEGLCQCNDGFDNDGDFFIDTDDPGCSGPSDTNESQPLESETCTVDLATMSVGPDGWDVSTTAGRFDDYTANSCPGDTGINNDVVYEIVLEGGADGLFASTVNRITEFDTTLYLRSTCDTKSSEVTCNDNAGTSDSSLIAWNQALAPGRYWLMVDGNGGGSSDGIYALQLSALLNQNRGCDPARQDFRCRPNLACVGDPGSGTQPTCQPAQCDTLEEFIGTDSTNGDTTFADDLFMGSCETSFTPEDVYRLTLGLPATSVVISVTSDDTNVYDPMLFVRASCQGTELGCNDDRDGTTLNPRLTLGPLAAGSYFIFVTGWGAEVGGYDLSVVVTP